MRRSSVRFRQAAPPKPSSDQPEHGRNDGGSSLLFARLRLSRTPGVPRAGFRALLGALRTGLIEPVKTRGVCARAEEVQVEIRGRDRLMTHPLLHRSGIDPTSQPQARGGVAEVVQPSPLTSRLPLHSPDHSAPAEQTARFVVNSGSLARFPSARLSTIGSTRSARGTRRDRRPFADLVSIPSD